MCMVTVSIVSAGALGGVLEERPANLRKHIGTGPRPCPHPWVSRRGVKGLGEEESAVR